jgi:hypothetical protein
LLKFKRLALSIGVCIAAPVLAQATSSGAEEAANPAQQALINNCSNHKFETVVVVDPVKKRGSRIKLCSNPGASDADWIKTLNDAIEQAGKQASLPVSAREELIAQLKLEIGKYRTVSAAKPADFVLLDPSKEFARNTPNERFEVSTLPPLEPLKKADGPASMGAGGVASAGAATGISAVPQKPMRIAVRCLIVGERGAGGTCDFFEKDTVLAVRAIEGLEEGGKLRFRRRGDEKGTVDLAELQPGQTARVRLPGELCRGVKTSKVEIELLGPTSRGSVAHRLGPFGLRC